MTPNTARLIVSGGFLLVYTISNYRGLYRRNRYLQNRAEKQYAMLLYLVNMIERSGVEVDEFDQIVLEDLKNG